MVAQARNCSHDVKNELALKVVKGDLLDIIISVRPFQEVHDNLNAVDEVNGVFNLYQLRIFKSLFVIFVIGSE